MLFLTYCWVSCIPSCLLFPLCFCIRIYCPAYLFFMFYFLFVSINCVLTLLWVMVWIPLCPLRCSAMLGLVQPSAFGSFAWSWQSQETFTFFLVYFCLWDREEREANLDEHYSTATVLFFLLPSTHKREERSIWLALKRKTALLHRAASQELKVSCWCLWMRWWF